MNVQKKGEVILKIASSHFKQRKSQNYKALPSPTLLKTPHKTVWSDLSLTFSLMISATKTHLLFIFKWNIQMVC